MNKSSPPNRCNFDLLIVLPGIEVIVLDTELFALSGIGLIVLPDVELVGRLGAPVVLVATQWASRFEGLDSHE